MEPDSTPDNAIYVDYSTLSTFQTCKEQARLSFREHLQPAIQSPAIDFGLAFHRGREVLYLTKSIEEAKEAFIDYCVEERTALPLSMESDEKRSIERGLYILEGYWHRWKDEPYELVEIAGKGYTEVKFKVLFSTWRDRPVYLVGILDGVMRSLVTGRLWNWEVKTTSMGLTNFQNHCRPNHQISIYDWVLRTQFDMDIAGSIWDCIFVSGRQPKATSQDPWLRKGIDLEKDFARVETRRSPTDHVNLHINLMDMVEEYLTWCDKGREWWTQNTKACYMYGGCKFLDICKSNRNPQVISSGYIVKPWEPWKEKEATDAS